MVLADLLAQRADSMVPGERIAVRGFGTFAVRYRKAHLSRNPKTGAAVALPDRSAGYFKPQYLSLLDTPSHR